jgi:hypothetical protein
LKLLEKLCRLLRRGGANKRDSVKQRRGDRVLEEEPQLIHLRGACEGELGRGDGTGRRVVVEVLLNRVERIAPTHRVLRRRGSMADEVLASLLVNNRDGNQNRIGDIVNRDDIANVLRGTRKELENTHTHSSIYSTSRRDDVNPTRNRLGVRATNDRGADNHHRHITTVFNNKMLSHRLGHRVSVRPVAKNTSGDDSVEFRRRHLADLLDKLFRVETKRIELLLNFTIGTVGVNVACRNMNESSTVISTFGDVKHAESAESVQLDSAIKTLIEINDSSTVNDNIEIRNEF